MRIFLPRLRRRTASVSNKTSPGNGLCVRTPAGRNSHRLTTRSLSPRSPSRSFPLSAGGKKICLVILGGEQDNTRCVPCSQFCRRCPYKYLILLCLVSASHNPKTFCSRRRFVSAGGVANGHPGGTTRQAGTPAHAAEMVRRQGGVSTPGLCAATGRARSKRKAHNTFGVGLDPLQPVVHDTGMFLDPSFRHVGRLLLFDDYFKDPIPHHVSGEGDLTEELSCLGRSLG